MGKNSIIEIIKFSRSGVLISYCCRKKFIACQLLNFYFFDISYLKVGGNEEQWGSGRSQMLGNGLGPCEVYLQFKHAALE